MDSQSPGARATVIGMIRAPKPSISNRSRHRIAAAALTLAAGASAVAVAGCGGSSGNVLDPVAKAATNSAGAAGYKMNVSMTMTLPGSSTAVTAHGTGSFSPRDRAGSMGLDMNFGSNPQVVQALGSGTLHIEELIKGLTIYMKMPPAIASKLPGGKAWMKIDLQKAAAAGGIPGLSSLASNPASSDPSQFLQYLRAVSGNITNAGSESVGGVQTTHYQASINLDKVPDVLPSASRASGKQAISALEKATNLHQLPVDVWIDGQHLVRQMRMAFDTSTGGQSLKTVMTIAMPEYGPQTIPAAPPADQVFDLSSLLGSSG
jgi:hypothetical protein